MLLNLSDVLTSEGRVVKRTANLEMTSFDSRLGSFPIIEKQPVNFTFINVGEHRAKVEGSTRMKLSAACDRCMEETTVILDLTFDRVVTSPEYHTEDEEADDKSYMEGYQLNVETFIYHEILVNWPVKILCKEDCKGVCSKCGQNLNERECGCDTFVPDPRMAAIKDIFCRDKEV